MSNLLPVSQCGTVIGQTSEHITSQISQHGANKLLLINAGVNHIKDTEHQRILWSEIYEQNTEEMPEPMLYYPVYMANTLIYTVIIFICNHLRLWQQSKTQEQTAAVFNTSRSSLRYCTLLWDTHTVKWVC